MILAETFSTSDPVGVLVFVVVLLIIVVIVLKIVDRI